MTQSMSRKGSRLGNAKAESFYAMLKNELYYDWEGDDPGRFVKELGISNNWYNNSRIKRRLNGSSPVERRLNRAD